ncbi:hypothetical protein [Streptomyces sp. KMM 9044]|uniref:hypothetical protein n=1 Tax=Streptomyces sp. KMM 9044 TaxID=2744474 RepID=UPI00215162D9|nr:hypothetical protein [Streptomyces sp. KMM 9044]WAX81883.1 hypothetical protein HUV60_013875 [Streptomyces sp. KMM 9044]
MTQTGVVVGSPGYMSPEQATDKDIGTAAGFFSRGAVLVFAATGRGAFGDGAASHAALLYQVVHGEADLTGVPQSLLGLVRACLMKDPEQRPVPSEIVAALAEQGIAAVLWGWLPSAVVSTIATHAAGILDLEAPKATGVAPPRDSRRPPPVLRRRCWTGHRRPVRRRPGTARSPAVSRHPRTARPKAVTAPACPSPARYGAARTARRPALSPPAVGYPAWPSAALWPSRRSAAVSPGRSRQGTTPPTRQRTVRTRAVRLNPRARTSPPRRQVRHLSRCGTSRPRPTAPAPACRSSRTTGCSWSAAIR